MAKVKFRGFDFDERTVEMIQYAEQLAGFKFTIVQGSYSDSVGASAGTHDGGGAADFSVRLLTVWKRNRLLKALKDTVFAAWYRVKSQGFDSNHIHAIAIGCTDAAPLAKSQCKDFDKNLDGLKGHAPDKTYRPAPPVKYSMQAHKPIERKVSA